MSKKVAIVGAGFSGLSLAWALNRRGVDCEIFEKQSTPGGMISSTYDRILFESAANAVMASRNFELLLSDLQIEPVSSGFKSNSRWIFRKSPRRIPLTFYELLTAVFNIFIHWLKGDLPPNKSESVKAWGERVAGAAFVNYLITPALQGIYATTSDNLDAELVIGGMFNRLLRPQKGELRGSISAPSGMGQVIDKLKKYLENKNIPVNYEYEFNLTEQISKYQAVVLAVSLSDVPQIIHLIAPRAAEKLRTIPLLPVSTVVMGFERPRELKGFGCLFPRDQSFNSLGVLFNTDIFPHRGDLESESWIINRSEAADQSQLDAVLRDRKRLVGRDEKPLVYRVKQWQKGLPLYGTQLHSLLTSDIFESNGSNDVFSIFLEGARLKETTSPVFLTGNYLGGIGLARILDYNLRLTEKIVRSQK